MKKKGESKEKSETMAADSKLTLMSKGKLYSLRYHQFLLGNIKPNPVFPLNSD